MMHIEVEQITKDRTRSYLRAPDASTYWDVEIVTTYSGRSYYTVHHDGWVVLERFTRFDGADVWDALKAREPIPAEVLSRLPKLKKHS